MRINRPGIFIILSLVIALGLFLLIDPASRAWQSPFDRGLRTPIQGSTLTPTVITTPTPTATATPTFTPTNTGTPTATPTPAEGEPQTIGYSVEGRPLEVFRFGNGERVALIITGVHGGYEWNTVALADQLIEHIRSAPDLIPDDKTLYILRVLNPDGYERDKGPDGRANSNNVDLNRNWDANWQANWAGSACWNYRFITAGEGPGSEPETQALMKFMLDNNVERLINYHSAALGIFPGGWPKDQNSMDLAYALALVSPYSYPPVETDCQYTGQMIDWASAQGIAAVDVELRNHVDTDFEINLEVLRAFLGWEP